MPVLYVTFSCVFVPFQYGVLGQVCNLFVLIPNCFPSSLHYINLKNQQVSMIRKYIYHNPLHPWKDPQNTMSHTKAGRQAESKATNTLFIINMKGIKCCITQW